MAVHSLLLALIAFFTISLCGSLVAASNSALDIYVDSGASGLGSGTQAAPYTSLEQAFNDTAQKFVYQQTPTDVTLYIAGTFVVTQGFLVYSNESAVTRTLRFAAQPGQTATISCAGAFILFDIYRIDPSGNTSFHNLNVHNCSHGVYIRQSPVSTILDVDSVDMRYLQSPQNFLPSVDYGGGAITSYDDTVSIRNSYFAYNIAENGAVSLLGFGAGTRQVTHSQFLYNKGAGAKGTAGALYMIGGSVSNCYFAYNDFVAKLLPDKYTGGTLKFGGTITGISATVDNCQFLYNNIPAVFVTNPFYSNAGAESPVTIRNTIMYFNEWGLSCYENGLVHFHNISLWQNDRDLNCNYTGTYPCVAVYGPDGSDWCKKPCNSYNIWDRCLTCYGNDTCVGCDGNAFGPSVCAPFYAPNNTAIYNPLQPQTTLLVTNQGAPEQVNTQFTRLRVLQQNTQVEDINLIDLPYYFQSSPTTLNGAPAEAYSFSRYFGDALRAEETVLTITNTIAKQTKVINGVSTVTSSVKFSFELVNWKLSPLAGDSVVLTLAVDTSQVSVFPVFVQSGNYVTFNYTTVTGVLVLGSFETFATVDGVPNQSVGIAYAGFGSGNSAMLVDMTFNGPLTSLSYDPDLSVALGGGLGNGDGSGNQGSGGSSNTVLIALVASLVPAAVIVVALVVAIGVGLAVWKAIVLHRARTGMNSSVNFGEE